MSELRNKIEKGIAKDYGSRLRQLRERDGYSRQELAVLLDCSEETIGKVERGVQTMTYRRLIRVCDIFHVSLDYLLRGEDASGIASVPPSVIRLFQNADEHEYELLCRQMKLTGQALSRFRRDSSSCGEYV